MSAATKWVIGFLAACVIVIGVLLFAIWAWSGFGSMDLSTGGLVALILAVVFMIGLSAGLAAAMIYSNVSGVDAEVYRTGEETLTPPPAEQTRERGR
jgi:hypothetical protein